MSKIGYRCEVDVPREMWDVLPTEYTDVSEVRIEVTNSGAIVHVAHRPLVAATGAPSKRRRWDMIGLNAENADEWLKALIPDFTVRTALGHLLPWTVQHRQRTNRRIRHRLGLA